MPEDQVKIKKDSSSMGITCCSDENNYPYGTSLSLDDDLVDDLDISNLAVGDVVEIRGYEYDSKESSNKSIRLQMTSMKVNRENDDIIKRLYGD